MHKKDYILCTPKTSNLDVACLINNDKIQSVICPARQKLQQHSWMQKKNLCSSASTPPTPYAKTIHRDELCTFTPLPSHASAYLAIFTIKQGTLKKNNTKNPKQPTATFAP
ncbi:hypothetical protein DFH08DRAFT_953788 [Mycena albidolilacea]|uniref:Large ribosomal subunit protein uL4 C-terminal domain-containing protein n=1 Tax=Mycena albidolilacea TaxID=1033008 RepID=A0AAD7ADZ3_9AGAR|nr:hypothetical protein DFH08DRAFT_953788 [Mycena albidolilacea]